MNARFTFHSGNFIEVAEILNIFLPKYLLILELKSNFQLLAIFLSFVITSSIIPSVHYLKNQ